MGSFTQEDPAKDGLNWYVYCENNPINRIDPWGLDSYVFYDENDNGFVTKKKAEVLKKEMEAYYGTDCHLVSIGKGHISEKTGAELSAADYFKEKWNFMGRAGNKKIEGVVLYFHGPDSADGISFKAQGAGSADKWDYGFKMNRVNELNLKVMDALVLLGCHTGNTINSGYSNFAPEMSNRMVAKSTIASDGSTHTLSMGSQFLVTTSWEPKGWKVYKKLNDGSRKSAAYRLVGSGYLRIGTLLDAAKVIN